MFSAASSFVNNRGSNSLVNTLGGVVGVTTQSGVTFDDIRNTNGDIREIRWLLKGSLDTCHRLFKEAVEKGDAITQIQLSQARFGIVWGKDNEKDFSSLVIADLEDNFAYYPHDFELFNVTYREAMKIDDDWKAENRRSFQIFKFAASQGYLPAVLELKSKEWKAGENSYGFAVELRPYVGKGDKVLDFYFGKALKNGTQIGSALYYEGLYWMEHSLGIPVQYPKNGVSFESFIRDVQHRDPLNVSYGLDGFRHVGNARVLAPSIEAWRSFVDEKLAKVKISEPDFHFFNYDAVQIKYLLNEYKVSTLSSRSFVEDPVEGYEFTQIDGSKFHGFDIVTLTLNTLYRAHPIGDISIRKDNFTIHQTIDHPELQPVVKFIENILTRSGSTHSANAWLKRLGAQHV